MPWIILFNKPYQVLSQFTDEQGRPTLPDYLAAPGFKAAGRLDYDSEGLLLLTDDGVLQQQIANPRHQRWKTYWVQVEGQLTDAALDSLPVPVLEPGYPESEAFLVRRCLGAVVNEEWEHRRFAERDLDIIDNGSRSTDQTTETDQPREEETTHG